MPQHCVNLSGYGLHSNPRCQFLPQILGRDAEHHLRSPSHSYAVKSKPLPFCLPVIMSWLTTQAVEHLKSGKPENTFSMKFVQYTQSSKCKSASDSSVSYASAALTISVPNWPRRPVGLSLALHKYNFIMPLALVYCIPWLYLYIYCCTIWMPDL